MKRSVLLLLMLLMTSTCLAAEPILGATPETGDSVVPDSVSGASKKIINSSSITLIDSTITSVNKISPREVRTNIYANHTWHYYIYESTIELSKEPTITPKGFIAQEIRIFRGNLIEINTTQKGCEIGINESGKTPVEEEIENCTISSYIEYDVQENKSGNTKFLGIKTDNWASGSFNPALGACGELASANTEYVLNASATATATTCFTVTAENVTLNCYNGTHTNTITGTNTTNTYGIYSTQFNTTIRNCNISSFMHQIYFNGADNGTISDTKTNGTYTYGHGIYLYNGANYNTVSNCTVHAVNGHAIYMEGSSTYNTITNSIGITTDYCGYGIAAVSSSNYSTITNSVGQTTLDCSIVFSSAHYNTITNSTGYSSTYRGVVIDAGNGNRIENSTFQVGAPATSICTPETGYGNAIYVYRTSAHNIFKNNTFKNSIHPQLAVHADADNNTFFWNNFTNTSGLYVSDNTTKTSGLYVSDNTTKSHYNYSANGTNMGNFWFNVINGSVNITGSISSPWAGLYYGSAGTGYPYNDTNSLGKTFGLHTDYAPLVPAPIAPTTLSYYDACVSNYTQYGANRSYLERYIQCRIGELIGNSELGGLFLGLIIGGFLLTFLLFQNTTIEAKIVVILPMIILVSIWAGWIMYLLGIVFGLILFWAVSKVIWR